MTRVVFFGTPKIGATVLEKLVKNDLTPVAVVTREDKPAGRGRKTNPSPVKLIAQKYKIPILQPKKLKENQEFFEELKNLKPDLGVVAAYGRIIPREVLDIPKHGILNVHPSLLPKYRGASPIQSAILAGEAETGVTIILLDEDLDHGPKIAQERLLIDDKDTYESLADKLAGLGAKLLLKTITGYISGKIKPKKQDHSKATATTMFKKEDGYIDPENLPNSEKFQLMVRAFYPWPGVWTKFDGKIVKFLPGNLIQPEGKPAMAILEFRNGYPEIFREISRLFNL